VPGHTSLGPGSFGNFAGDAGGADPLLESALAGAAAPNGAAAVSTALLDARLIVPIVASPAAGQHGAEMALVTVIGRDGRRALPAFTSVDALARWRAQARPVPVSARRAAAAAYDEGAVALVLDVAGPIPHTISGSRLLALAEGRAWLPAHVDDRVAAAVRSHLLTLAGATVSAYLRPSEHADAVVLLVPSAGSDPAHVESIVRALATRLASDPELRARLDTGLDLAIATSAEQFLQRGVDEPS
jgi:hypothetical protein